MEYFRAIACWTGALLSAAGLVLWGEPVSMAAEAAPPTESTLAVEPAEGEPASLDVSGYGFFGNRRLKQTLRGMLPDDPEPRTLDSPFIEDALFLLFSQITQEGFLRPQLTVQLTLADGAEETYQFDELLEIEIPAGRRVAKAHFMIDEGVRYHFRRVEFSGLKTIRDKQARAFFIETGVLLPLNRYRIYTPQRLKRGLESLVQTLQREGYQNARASAARVDIDDATGRVEVLIEAEEGDRFMVRSVREEIRPADTNAAPEVRMAYPNEAYSRVWEQNFAQGLRTNFFHRGHPDTTVTMETAKQEPANGVVNVDSLATVEPGPRVKVGAVRFLGNERTKPSVMARRVPLESGDWLDRMEAERGRLRLSRLGVFDTVELKYEPAEGEVRDLIYRVNEGRRIDLSLLFGYGSYELLRGGIDLRQFNLFGRAHQSHLRLVQSFKSSRAAYTYTMPEFFGEDWDVFARAAGFRREEVNFTRTEYGGGAGMERYFRRLDSTIALRYEYQILDATDLQLDLIDEGVQNPAVGAFIFDLRHDRRDNILYPRRGYRIFGNLEVGSELFLGDVNYERVQFSGSYHRPLDEGRWLHFGLSHGFVAAIGSPGEDLPFTRRFFPGGESSIRGYQEGQASSRNARGNLVGSESFLLGTVEFEQALTPALSLVFFSDSLGVARRISDYPMDESLFSAGGGLRWRTLVGPIRVEYGHNLNPRRDDPSGTLHFSLGFPF